MRKADPQPQRRLEYTLGTFSYLSPTAFSHQEMLETLGFHSAIKANCRHAAQQQLTQPVSTTH